MTAAQLIQKLCVPLGHRACAWLSERHEEDGYTRHAGFAGCPFAGDGYEFMARAVGEDGSFLLPNPGQVIEAVPDAGNWPLEVFMWSPSERAIITYVEGDVAVDVYDTDDLARAALAQVIAENPAP